VNPGARVHRVKSWPRFFEAIRSGARTHELRKNDRSYEVGDILHLEEYDPDSGAYSGRTCYAEITSMTATHEPCAVSAEGLHRDYCILSIRRIANPGIEKPRF